MGALAVKLAQFEERRGLDRALEVQVQFRLWELTDKRIGRANAGYGSHHLL